MIILLQRLDLLDDRRVRENGRILLEQHLKSLVLRKEELMLLLELKLLNHPHLLLCHLSLVSNDLRDVNALE